MDINNNNNDGVAIIGIGFRIPSGGKGNLTGSELWEQLLNGLNGIVNTNERWNENLKTSGDIPSTKSGLLSMNELKSFDPLFFGISPSETETIDPQQRLLLKCTWEALEDSLIDPLKIRGTNTPVYIGSTFNDYLEISKTQNVTANPNVFGGLSSAISNRISYCFGLNGKSMTIDTACSSSLNAIRLASNSIKYGNSKLAIAGGTSVLLDPFILKSFSYLGMLSKSGISKPFDKDADGMVRSEGVGIVVMKNLKDAIKDGNNIYCVIDGSSSNVDNSSLLDKPNFYYPSKSSHSNNINQAILSTNGKLNCNDIDFVEAHGTGTPVGDPIEVEGIAMALSINGISNKTLSNPLLIGKIKSNVGHCEAASGVMALIKCCLMFKNKYFAPNINFDKPNPDIKFDEWNLKVVTKPIPFPSNKPVSMVINNFGVTGSNCCLIVSQFIKQQTTTSTIVNSLSSKSYLIPFSANSSNSLQQYISKINGHNGGFCEFANKQIKSKSIGLNQRSVIVASNWNEFKDQTNMIKTSNDKLSSNMSFSSNKKNAKMVFVFCGQNSQYQTMGKQLYDTEPIFKQSIDLLDDKLSKYYGFSVMNKLRSIPNNDIKSLQQQYIAQPSTFIIQVSLFELYKHWGINPSFIIGHSFGEITAAYCSGMIDLDTACYIVYNRSIAQSKTNGLGKMLSINISDEEYSSKYSSRYPLIEISCYNSPTSIVIAGNELQLFEISKDLSEQGISSTMLGSLTSFHTSSQLIIKDDILNINYKSTSPKIPIFSTVTSSLFNPLLQFNSEYLYENIIKPVNFKSISIY